MAQDLFQYLPPITTLATRVPRRCFGNPQHRLVVSVLPITTQNDLVLVEPRHAPTNRDWLIPMQEKVKRRTDFTLGSAVRRGLRKEICRSKHAITLHPTELYRYRNHVPERRGQPALTKFILVFGARVSSIEELSPNHAEVRRVVAVGPDDLLDCLPPRTEKFCGIMEACEAAVRVGLLSQSRWLGTLTP